MKRYSQSRRLFCTKALTAASCAGAVSLKSGTGYSSVSKTAWTPKISEHIGSFDDAMLRWMAQIGLKHVVFMGWMKGINTAGKGFWTIDDVTAAKKKCESFGLTLESLLIPIEWYQKNSLGKPGRDEEIEYIVRSIKTAAEAGISFLEWRPVWPDFYWDDRVGYYRKDGRGRAQYQSFDYSRVKNLPPFEDIGEVSNEEMWERMLYFGKPVVDAAEKAGIKLSMHPNDPPVPVMRGVARIFTSMTDAERMIKEFPSPAYGITFCQGTFTEMGVNIFDAIRRLGSRIHHVHLRGVRGKVPMYNEVFIDEGDIDMFESLKTYKEIGYTGTIVSDHTPGVEGGTLVGLTFSHGYIRAMMQVINSLA